MVLDDAISTEPIREKLRNLRDYMPEENDEVYQFGEFLADRLNPELVPGGFNIAAELALHDLQKGIDGFSGQPIRSRLVGYPPQIYAYLRMRVPDIAEVVCSEDFAKGVREFYDEVNKRMEEK